MVRSPRPARGMLRRCPRCRGPLARDRDRHGAYESCFLCGYTRDHLEGPALDMPESNAGDRGVAVGD